MGLFDDIPIVYGEGDGYNPITGRLQITVRPMRPQSDVATAGEYGAVSTPTETGDRAFGRYKVMGADIGPWTKEILGRELSPREFLLWPDAQDAVFEEKFGQDVERKAPAPAARAWFTSGAPNPDAGGAAPVMFAQQAPQDPNGRGAPPTMFALQDAQDPDGGSAEPMTSAPMTQSELAPPQIGGASADMPDSPFERAALTQSRKARPPGGRKEGLATAFPEEMAVDTLTLPRRFGEAVTKYARTGELDAMPILEGALMAAGFGGPLVRMLMGRAARVARTRQSVDAARRRLTHARGTWEALPRPFDLDYLGRSITDRTGRLLRDLDNRRLTAKYITGRRVRGGADEGISAADFPQLSESVGVPMKRVPPREIKGDAAIYRERGFDDGPITREILLRNDLSARELPLVQAHELGHAIDSLAGRVPQWGIQAELRMLYHLLNSPRWNHRWLISPEDFKYPADKVRRELMAEAIRAYLSDPNFIKTVAPNTAARIRGAWNSLPELSKILQFNTLAAGAAGALGAAGQGSGGGPPTGDDGI